MIHKTFEIDTGNQSVTRKATLTTYILDNHPSEIYQKKRPLVLICPGGGYRYCSEREAEVIAIRLNSFGYNTAILRYNCGPEKAHFPENLSELCHAMKLLRTNAQEFNTNPDKIAVMGFSAGGHLAASLGVFWQEEWLEKETGLKKEQYQPNALILTYPVITSGEFAHRGSFDNLLGEQTEELLEKTSLEKHVTQYVPPVFLWSTWTDNSVPIENSLLFVNELKKAGVSCELHIFMNGTHGLSTADYEVINEKHQITMPNIAVWPELLKAWLRELWGTDYYFGK